MMRKKQDWLVLIWIMYLLGFWNFLEEDDEDMRRKKKEDDEK